MNEQTLELIVRIAEVCLIPLFGYLTTLLINKINTKLEADKKKAEAEKEGSGMSGCTIFFLIILSIAMPWTLIFTIPYFIYKASKSND